MQEQTERSAPNEVLDRKEYIIWSHDHRAWWKPGGWGYTTLTHLAGRFSKEVAEQFVQHANIVAVKEVMMEAPTNAAEEFMIASLEQTTLEMQR